MGGGKLNGGAAGQSEGRTWRGGKNGMNDATELGPCIGRGCVAKQEFKRTKGGLGFDRVPEYLWRT